MHPAFFLATALAVLSCSGKTVPAAAPSRFLDYQTQAQLRLPFEGSWFVAWGGRSVEQNQHAVARDQRFALDLLVLDPAFGPSDDLTAAWTAGKSHRANGSKNKQYRCYGLPIVAPGDGRVVSVQDGLSDNKPGEFDVDHPGNTIVIDHGNDEFSMMAHFKPGSILVEPDDLVAAGERIAECGNSGRSSEAHLHYHLQNTPRWFDGEGLPIQFENYEADGEPVGRGEPIRGQLVRQLECVPGQMARGKD